MHNFSLNIGLLIFRIAISAFMLFGHGLGKFQKLLSGDEIKFLDLFGFGTTFSFSMVVFAEFFASILIIFGLFTRISTFSLIVTMSVAAFIAHASDPFPRMEKSLLYLVSYILIYFTGPGKYSLQTLINKKWKPKNNITKYICG